MTLPLVSCIMPTYNRRHFVPGAIEYFLRQDYANKELVIVDDGTDFIEELVPKDDRISYVSLYQKATVGAKRNLACEQAGGEIIAHWDDDDWHAPHRLSYQVEHLLRTKSDVCGINTLLFYDMAQKQGWQYTYTSNQRFWLSGSSLCYTKEFWASHPFPLISVGEDARFVWSGQPQRMTALPDHTFHIGIIHEHNVSAKNTRDAYWKLYPTEKIQALMGKNWKLYQPAQVEHVHPRIAKSRTPTKQKTPDVAAEGTNHLSVSTKMEQESLSKLITSKRNISMITVARESDLALPEFAAFNHSQSLPRMRRWELPFVLFQSRLTDNMSILDCTVNPVAFQHRLTSLFPNTLYRHFNPIQNGRFTLPLGLPDGSFDRVICVNTLEHLLRTQREALIAEVARKLKPGGCFVFTYEYYFDSCWSEPALLNCGIVTADRREVFNGFNKISLLECVDTARQYGLESMGEMVREPNEGDPDLYCNLPPYRHTCIGAVFTKLPQSVWPEGKRIVLALLTWNTRQASLESLNAYVREAQMLQRLGQIPFLCVCDNGSSDGTAEALRILDAQIDLSHKFILNSSNLGNSIARNQIIEYVLACDADYVMFVDGDIEIVPFSTFAMLRHMEANGHRLGCIGANSMGQTPHRGQASPVIYSISDFRIATTNVVAWTQYGLFRRAIFDAGVHFDETSPFDQPGWGFEDNDLAYQMEINGFVNQYFSGMTYLHRNARSSVRLLRQARIDVDELFAQRKQYVINKWASVPEINNGPLNEIRKIKVIA